MGGAKRRRAVEESLILCSAQRAGDADSERELERLCGQSPDWEYIADRSVQEGISGLLHRTFSEQIPGRVPDRVARRLKREYCVTFARNLEMLSELDRVLDGLAHEGIPVLLLPGVTLLPQYDDLGCRPMDDVDLLVKGMELPRVAPCMKRLGYIPQGSYPSVFSRKEVTFDVHTDPLNVSRIRSRAYAIGMRTEDVWRSARGWRGPEDLVLTLSPEDTFVYLCGHLVKHSFSRLIWFMDLHELLRGESLPDWNLLMERAHSFNLDRSVAYCTIYLKRSMGVSIEGMGGENLSVLERYILRGMLKNRGLGRFGDLLFALSVRDIRHRLALLWETCFPKPDVMDQVFPNVRSRAPRLVYLLRLGQVIGYALDGCTRLAWALMRSAGMPQLRPNGPGG